MADMTGAKYWEREVQEFQQKTRAFYNGELSLKDYKGFSGMYGSYAQKGGERSMLRLRMPAGCVSKERLKWIVDVIRKYQVPRVHVTTCQTIQLHDLMEETVCTLVPEALDAGIMVMGGGGDFPRNVMCSPLSGVEKDEYFDVMPWALAAGEFLLGFIRKEKMPRKLKVGFSNSPANLSHATYRDLGFAARPGGLFDVYSAGGLGMNPRFGVKVAEGIEPEKILYYIKAMWLTFLAHGNYENRAKARTRYMQESLGGPEEYKNAFLQKLEEVFASEENLDISVEHAGKEMVLSWQACDGASTSVKVPVSGDGNKQGSGMPPADWRVLEQKQEGLYTVLWHPLGGQPAVEELAALYETVCDMEEVELRLSPDESVYIVNLTADEVGKVLEVTKNGAKSVFETSVSCIGASTCQIGLRDSQGLLQACIKAVREAGLPEDALPQMHISGCPSSCGTHQTGVIGFRGGGKLVDKKPQSAFVLYVGGNEHQGRETMGKEIGTILETQIPEFIVKLGKEVEKSGMGFYAWREKYPDAIETIAKPYVE